jgi:hypothetical protein
MIDQNIGLPKLPELLLVRQLFEVPPPINIEAAVEEEFSRIRSGLNIFPGAKIALGVGSRGVENLSKVVKQVIRKLKELGADPFIAPAMGSHGGATAEGQVDVLRHRGITEEVVGVPIRATMDVVELGKTENGVPVFLDRFSKEADGVVAINRVKPHTNFIGKTESGILKMMSIGFGNQVGATHYHKLCLIQDQYTIISSVGKAVIERSKFLFGVCLVENQVHQTCDLRMARADEVEAVESEMLVKARELLPVLPMDQVDLLIVDEMGKDISGQGIDPNVVGRDCCAYGARRQRPSIARIFIRDLTEASEGAAVGIGMADFTLKSLVDKIDFHTTAINNLTACCPEGAMIPLAFENDREAIKAALMSIRPYDIEDLGIVHIRNTRDLEQLLVSRAYKEHLSSNSGVEIVRDNLAMEFDRAGMLISRSL